MARLCAGTLWLGWVGTLLVQAGCAGPSAGIVPAWPTAAAAPKQELSAAQAIQSSRPVGQTPEKDSADAQAIEQYERAERLDPGNLQACRRLALLYGRRGEFLKADAEYGKLAKARPRDADVFNDWGYSFYERHQWAEAERQLSHALQLDPGNARARCNLGLVLGQEGRYQEAFEAFRPVVGEAQAHADLGFVYWSKGMVADARRECQAARQLDPSCRQAIAMLTQLDRHLPQPTANERRAVNDRPAPAAVVQTAATVPTTARVAVNSWPAPAAVVQTTATVPATARVAVNYQPAPAAVVQTAVVVPTTAPPEPSLPLPEVHPYREVCQSLPLPDVHPCGAVCRSVVYHLPMETAAVPVAPPSPPPAPEPSADSSPTVDWAD